MFGDMKNMGQQMKMIQRMMQDENFRAFLMHPKVQALVKDPDFVEAMKGQDPEKMKSHPKLETLREDPELRDLMTKVDFQGLFG